MRSKCEVRLVNATSLPRESTEEIEVFDLPGDASGITRVERDYGCGGHERVVVVENPVLNTVNGFRDAKAVLLVRDDSACQMDNECRAAGKQIFFLYVPSNQIVRSSTRWFIWPYLTQFRGRILDPVRTIHDLPHFDLLASGCCACGVDGTVYSTRPVADIMRQLEKAGKITDSTVKVALIPGDRRSFRRRVRSHGCVLMVADFALTSGRKVHTFRASQMQE
jgi:hypothetical protein